MLKKISAYIRTSDYLLIMETVNYTEFRSNLEDWLDEVIEDVSFVIKHKARTILF